MQRARDRVQSADEESRARVQRSFEAAQLARHRSELEEPTPVMVCDTQGQARRQRWCWVKCSNGGSTITLLALGCESLPVVLPYIPAARVTCDW